MIPKSVLQLALAITIISLLYGYITATSPPLPVLPQIVINNRTDISHQQEIHSRFSPQGGYQTTTNQFITNNANEFTQQAYSPPPSTTTWSTLPPNTFTTVPSCTSCDVKGTRQCDQISPNTAQCNCWGGFSGVKCEYFVRYLGVEDSKQFPLHYNSVMGPISI